VLVHGLGFSPDHKTLAIVSIGSNSVSFIDTQTNAVKHVTYVGRSPHEAFFTPDGSEVWVTVRGEDYISVIDATTFAEKSRISVPNGPGMQIFSPDGVYGYVCSSFTPETVVVTVKDHKVVGHVRQASPFCPNIAASPDGRQVWFTLKDSGKVQIFDAHPPFAPLKTLDTGPITNHVNFAATPKGVLAYVTVGALNQVKVFRTDSFEQIAAIAVGSLPHGVWPSGDGTHVYVGLENDDTLVAIDTATNQVISTSPLGQAPQALVYVPDAVPLGDGKRGLQPLGQAAAVMRLSLVLPKRSAAAEDNQVSPTSVSLFDQGLTQILEASVSGLRPGASYVLAFAERPDGGGALQALSAFRTNPAGAAIVNATGPIRQVIKPGELAPRRYLVIVAGIPEQMGEIAQVEQQ
jgi:YVTN family beta-propeller protein